MIGSVGMELVCPAGTLTALRYAVDAGADAVYVGFRDGTNARHFPGLNFSEDDLESGVNYAHERGAKVFVAINTYPQERRWSEWIKAVDTAAQVGVDALILADMGILDYAATRWPAVRRHLSVQASATNSQALEFYGRRFGVSRAVLPRVLSLKQVLALAKNCSVDVEVFGFGSLCVMAEGRCFLSSYVTGQSPNTYGACSPAAHVRWETHETHCDCRVNGVLIDQYKPNENAGYPTLCKGRYRVGETTYHALERPTSLNALNLLPTLRSAGVKAIKVEGRQRSPTYVRQVTEVMRKAIDACVRNPDNYVPHRSWMDALNSLSEGSETTLGAYDRTWC